MPSNRALRASLSGASTLAAARREARGVLRPHLAGNSASRDRGDPESAVSTTPRTTPPGTSELFCAQPAVVALVGGEKLSIVWPRG